MPAWLWWQCSGLAVLDVRFLNDRIMKILPTLFFLFLAVISMAPATSCPAIASIQRPLTVVLKNEGAADAITLTEPMKIRIAVKMATDNKSNAKIRAALGFSRQMLP
jgi:hypothetical protein